MIKAAPIIIKKRFISGSLITLIVLVLSVALLIIADNLNSDIYDYSLDGSAGEYGAEIPSRNQQAESENKNSTNKIEIEIETPPHTDTSSPEALHEATDTKESSEAEESALPPTTNPPVKINPRVYQNEFDRIRLMYNDNEDIIGVVKIPGTVIYYPVAQHVYNNEHYLDRNLFGQLSAAGSIVLDFENSVERYDPNTILYGHQMSSNSMFHSLNYYRDEYFFNNHRYIIFNTIYENNVWEVFAFFEAHVSFNYIKVFFRSERDFLRLAEEMKEKSLYDTGIDIKHGDRILTLSTCTNLDRDTRFVLAARMIKNKGDIPAEIAAQMLSAAEDYE